MICNSIDLYFAFLVQVQTNGAYGHDVLQHCTNCPKAHCMFVWHFERFAVIGHCKAPGAGQAVK